MAELVDAQVSGTCGREAVEVRVFSWAPLALGKKRCDCFRERVNKSGREHRLPNNLTNNPESIELHFGDLPSGLSFGDSIAVDTETQGLHLKRDRLCVVQLTAGNGVCHLVQIPAENQNAPNLQSVLVNPAVTKIFHYARFDVAVLKRKLDIMVSPIFCTKIASKLVRTYTDRHGLQELSKELLNIEISKEQQSSDWAAEELTKDQLKYAAADVLHLHQIHDKLNDMLIRENRLGLAQACFDFLLTRVELDLKGWEHTDIFAHS